MRSRQYLGYLFASTAIFQGIFAIFYDWYVLIQLPWYLVPLIAICPLYPFLLALGWMQFRNTQPQTLLTGFGIVPAIGFGILAPFYFTQYAITFGFSWVTIGQIAWVLGYAMPALLLLSSLSRQSRILGLVWFVISLTTQLFSAGSGYLYLGFWNFNIQVAVIFITTFSLGLLMQRWPLQSASASQSG